MNDGSAAVFIQFMNRSSSANESKSSSEYPSGYFSIQFSGGTMSDVLYFVRLYNERSDFQAIPLALNSYSLPDDEVRLENESLNIEFATRPHGYTILSSR
ncbi:hypothetical protein OGATHE_004036 [Ogataea polymorpha]|uniref:Uncharacterized protein n=1 Tax=Ogataea polymorpha TaxID=460523 RepID=A0A9P8T3Z1_9ASCO|nr:hypothetical protein OGATHE_004036 [Ogataea polymorpha]